MSYVVLSNLYNEGEGRHITELMMNALIFFAWFLLFFAHNKQLVQESLLMCQSSLFYPYGSLAFVPSASSYEPFLLLLLWWKVLNIWLISVLLLFNSFNWVMTKSTMALLAFSLSLLLATFLLSGLSLPSRLHVLTLRCRDWAFLRILTLT